MGIKLIRACSVAIMILAAWNSYGHQHALLRGWGVDSTAALTTPLTVDLLAIICTVAIHMPGIAKGGRGPAIVVLLVAGTVSCGANFIAGSTLGSKLSNVWAVVAYLLAEWVAARVKAIPRVAVDPQRSEAARKAHVTRRANKAKVAPPQKRRQRMPATGDQAIEAIRNSGVAPVSPAVSPAPARK